MFYDWMVHYICEMPESQGEGKCFFNIVPNFHKEIQGSIPIRG